MTDVLYGAQGSSNTTSDLYTIDPATGVTTSVGPIGYALTALAFDPTTGILYGLTSSNSAASPNSLITINISTGAGTLVGAIGNATPDADFNSSGQLYTLFGNVGGGSGHPLVSINKATGAPTTIGAPGFRFGTVAFSSTDVLYTIDNDTVPTYLATLNTSTGAGTVGALVTSGTGPQGAASYDSAGLLWFTDNAFFAPNLYSIDVGVTNTQTYHSSLDREIDAIGWLRGGGGDTTPPTLLSIRASGTRIVLTYDESLADTTLTSEFSATANGNALTIVSSSVVGSTVHLTVAPEIRIGETVLVSYTG